MRRPTRTAIAINAAILVSAVVGAIVSSPDANWDLPQLALLMIFAIASDLMAASIRSAKMKVSGSFLAIVVAMVLLGGAPAALVGVVTILAGWVKWRERPHYPLSHGAPLAFFPPLRGGVFWGGPGAPHPAPGDT